MDVKGFILLFFIVVISWFIFGFIGFLIEAKRLNYDAFDQETRREFAIIVCSGLLAFIAEIIIIFVEWFIDTMDKLLKKINQ